MAFSLHICIWFAQTCKFRRYNREAFITLQGVDYPKGLQAILAWCHEVADAPGAHTLLAYLWHVPLTEITLVVFERCGRKTWLTAGILQNFEEHGIVANVGAAKQSVTSFVEDQ